MSAREYSSKTPTRVGLETKPHQLQWKTEDGRILRLPDMETDHLINAMNILRKRELEYLLRNGIFTGIHYVRCMKEVLAQRGVKTTVVNKYHDAYDVYVGQGSRWGNPFKMTPTNPREEVIAAYEDWLLDQPKLISALPDLQYKKLGCFCKPLPCHGDVLARLCNSL